MRKIGNCAVSCALVLAIPTAIGQEKPKVEVEKPKTDVSVKIQNLSGQAELHRLLMDFRAASPLNVKIDNTPGRLLIDNGNRIILLNRRLDDLRDEASLVGFTGPAQPVMNGDLESIVEEIGKALRIVRDGDQAERLAALDEIQRATMRARRSLRTLTDLKDAPSDDEVRALTQMQFFRVSLQQQDTTPLGKARAVIERALLSVRKATNIEEAKKAFDDVEKGTADLRALLWEEKSEKD